MRRHHLDDLPAYGIDRVEMAQWVLEDHGDLLAVECAMGFVADLEQVLPVIENLAAHDMGGWHVENVHHRRSRHRLARAAFAQDGQRLAAIDAP